MALAWPRRSETTFTASPAASSSVAWVCRRSCSRIRGSWSFPSTPSLYDLLDEPARVQLRVAARAVECALDERGVPYEFQGQRPPGRPVRAQGGDHVRVDVHDARLAGLRRAFDESFTGTLGFDHPDAAPDLQPVTLLVESPPGDPGLPPHRHPGPAIGYMLEGEMLFEVEGEPERVIRAGEAFWEPGGDLIHYQDGNNRTDTGLRFIATLMCPPGAPLFTVVGEEELAQRKDRRAPRPPS